MRKILAVLLVMLLLNVSVDARRKVEVLQQQKQTPKEKQTVVESNHYSSKTETKISYDIKQIQKDKSLVFLLKPHTTDTTDKHLEDNPITITLKDGEQVKSCLFNTYTQLCALSKVTKQIMTLTIECKKTPCELSWLLLQPPVFQNDGDHAVDNLVSVNKEKDHAALRIFCENPDLGESVGKDLVLYTNSKYKKIVSQRQIGEVYYLFDNEQQGYYFLTTSNEKLKQCVNVSLQHMNDEIQFNHQKDIFMDFIEPGKAHSYPFKTIPSKDFRLDGEMFDVAFGELTNQTGVVIDLIGYQGSKKILLSTLDLHVDNQKSSIQFSVVYKKPAQKFDKMQLEFTTKEQTLMLRAKFIQADIHEVQLGELNFFDLKKGEAINYKLVPLDKEIEGIKEIHIFPSSQKFKVSKAICPPEGCEFTVEAKEDGKGDIYIGQSDKRNTSEIIIQKFQKSITSKIFQGEVKYYEYQAKAHDALQFLINVPSVIVYAGNKEKCPTMDLKCYETNFNHHFPSIYQPSAEGLVLFKVVGLDNCQFTLTIIDEKTPFIELKDTEPFTYLFDDRQKSLVFQFKMQAKEDVSFNLIGPVNELNLYVLNEERPAVDDKQKWQDAQLSSDGFIQFTKDEIKGLNFAIKVQKRPEYQNKYIHFTIITSTKQANLRLQTGLAHYQTLKPKDTRDYVFEFIPDHKILLNFYTHNLHNDIKLRIRINNADQYDTKNGVPEFTVDRNVDVLDIGLVSSRLCQDNKGENCQLFVRIENLMEVQADVTITLLVDNSIIELKDGIWQSYGVNSASTSAHFYFLPKHLNHSATIFYKPSVVDLRILYSVWKSDDLSINPSEWPFPVTIQQSNGRFGFKPLQYIHIEPQSLKECWPNCVILLSMITNSKEFQQQVEKNSSLLDAHFRIMGTNNYIELAEKHKIDILLSKNETKELLVDLKYYMQKQQITFYTHYTIGNPRIRANVYSQKNPRCPTADDPADFQFSEIETSLTLQDIKKKISENSIQNDKNIYLCLLAEAGSENTKFNIQFNSDGEGYKKLPIDSTTTLKTSNKETLYYIDNSQQVYLKITRNSGFPYYQTKLCKPEIELSKCFKDFESENDNKIQIANKITSLTEPACPKCVLLLKIEAKQAIEIVLHTQSKFTELQLSESTVVSDSLTANQQNRYTLTGTKDQQIIINIQIISGDLKVGIKDFQKIDLTKTNEKGSKNIHITVPPKDLKKEEKQLGTTHMSSFQLSNFVHLHITVQSQDHSKSAMYSIVYSKGSPIVYLQDGLITQYILIPHKQTRFIYKNPSKSSIYLYTSTPDSESQKKLKFKYYYMDNTEDEDQKTQIQPQKSDAHKKMANPSHLVKLPGKQAYFLQVTSENDKNVVFTIGVNNREIIYLPFEHEFPIQLAVSEYIYLVLNFAVQGHVKLTFSKCSISYPFISYTDDYDEFIAEDYSIEDRMDEDLVSQLVLKVKSSSGLYIRVKSSDTERTLMSVKAVFSTQKLKLNRAKPGDKGLIQYQLLDSTKAELTFTNLVCNADEKNCNKNFVFTALNSDKLQNIYSQLVCSSIMFSLPELQQLKAPTLTPISSSSSTGNKVTFTQSISGDIEYVGVKALNSKTGQVVYYQPVQIVTFWGQLHRSSQTTIGLGIFLMTIFICGALMVYRRYKKNEYRPLGEMNDAIDRD